MRIKITDDRQEMAKVGRNLARLTRADISSDKYKDYREDMDILYPQYGGVLRQKRMHFMHGFITSGCMG